MVLILDGNSEIGAQVRSHLCYLIRLMRSREVTNREFYPKWLFFVHACATCSELPSNISIMDQNHKIAMRPHATILDGNSDYVAHDWGKIGLFGEKIIRHVNGFGLIKWQWLLNFCANSELPNDLRTMRGPGRVSDPVFPVVWSGSRSYIYLKSIFIELVCNCCYPPPAALAWARLGF